MRHSYKTLAWETRDRVLWIRLNRPDTMNAVDDDLHYELSLVFEDADRDPESDVVVLTGSGRAFCAGGLASWMEQKAEHPDEFREILPDTKRIVFSQLQMEKPIICALNGAAAGLGASIALMCDLIVAADTATIGDPHVRMGFVAGDGGPVILPQLVGYARAKEMLLLGSMLSAEEARSMGLINRVVPAAELEAATEKLALQLARGAKWAIRWTKTVTNIPLRRLAQDLMDASVAYEMASNLTTDHREAVRAFIEKRRPVFTGN
ncbi:enoyl-CoA hydratase/isomerase family protein [Enterovirga sp. CN4-39]|uniref:enoyl-CoA hydratase/isomerase family protein n=1 Tax=Enterovirga sp. CN4-39 TaxID=3400910 RepID=UPI003C031D2B